MGKFYRLFFYSCVLSFQVLWFAFLMDKRPFLLLLCPDPPLLPGNVLGALPSPPRPHKHTLHTLEMSLTLLSHTQLSPLCFSVLFFI